MIKDDGGRSAPPPGEIGLRIELEHFGHCCIGFGCEMIPLQVYQSCGLPAMCRVQRAEESSSEIGQDKILRLLLQAAAELSAFCNSNPLPPPPNPDTRVSNGCAEV